MTIILFLNLFLTFLITKDKATKISHNKIPHFIQYPYTFLIHQYILFPIHTYTLFYTHILSYTLFSTHTHFLIHTLFSTHTFIFKIHTLHSPTPLHAHKAPHPITLTHTYTYNSLPIHITSYTTHILHSQYFFIQNTHTSLTYLSSHTLTHTSPIP